MDGSQHSTALAMISVTHITPVLVLLSVVRVGMQQCIIIIIIIIINAQGHRANKSCVEAPPSLPLTLPSSLSLPPPSSPVSFPFPPAFISPPRLLSPPLPSPFP